MIKIKDIKISIKEDKDLKDIICKKYSLKEEDILSYEIKKKSIDARKKNDIYYVYEIDLTLNNEDIFLKKKYKNVSKTKKEYYKVPSSGVKSLVNRPVIVGSGPAGLFCGLLLSECGYNPLIIERGEKIEDRVKTVEKFWKEKKLNINSNVQFGEGGAGTFSDGKLNTLVKDKEHRGLKVFETFVECGADESILYEQKPHIGTDVLRKVIINLRNKILSLGGKILYNTTLTDINIENNKIKSITVNNKEQIPCDVLVLAIGHSSRDTFKMLYEKSISMQAKPFAVGVRVQHNQDEINFSQYGEDYKVLPPASYKLTYKTKDNRGVYSFCMCPGGYVVNASSEEKRLAINGMSYNKRDSKNANSAIIVTVSLEDFGNDPMDGIAFQRELEETAYKVGNGNIPTQRLEDFYNNKETTKLGKVTPITKGDYTLTNLNNILPEFIIKSLKEAFPYFGTKIKGFDDKDTLISGVESRTSSPIRINRDEFLESSIKGIYPCGEGSGYAGGITTSSMDGLKVAEEIIKEYSKEF